MRGCDLPAGSRRSTAGFAGADRSPAAQHKVVGIGYSLSEQAVTTGMVGGEPPCGDLVKTTQLPFSQGLSAARYRERANVHGTVRAEPKWPHAAAEALPPGCL